MEGATTPAGQVGITAVGDSWTATGESTQETGLETTVQTSGAGGLINWIRQSPWTVEEAKLLIDAGVFALMLVLLYLEVTA